ncbi:MAG TPA: FtsX-like permease family protein, partial [Gemmatimonadaceae bacterium]|nr:FtsX-like permease family protein [Gemmatimonadaceae bacterium]
VLLITCANLAGLFLARGLRRRKEIAVRLALGATHWRLVRHLLTESVVLALVGGAIGAVIAVWGKDLVQTLYQTDYAGRPINFSLEIGWSALAWTFGLSALTGIAAGLVPALQGRRTDVMSVLRDESTGSGLTRLRFRNLLVLGQVALSILLLIGAGLMVRSLRHLYDERPFDLDHVIVLRLRPSLVGYDSTRAWAFQRDVLRRMQALPGVEAASVSEGIPMFGGGADLVVSVPRRSGQASVDTLRVPSTRVGGGYFRTLGAGVVDGREFTDEDRAGAPDVAILNEVLARRLWPNERAIERLIVLDGKEHRVVGIVRDLQARSIVEQPQPYIFRSYWQQDDRSGWQQDSRTHVRVRGDPLAMLPVLRREVAAIDPSVPVSEDYPLADRMRFTFQPVRVASSGLVFFGVVALGLSVIGLYGVLAFAVSQRTREIAIRLALGANQHGVAWLVVRHSAMLAGCGAALGLAAALGGVRFLRSLLYGVPAYDLAAFTFAPLVLIAVTLLASYIPARRATRIDQLMALRHE